MNKSMFDVALIPGMRESLNKYYSSFRKDHDLSDRSLLGNDGTFLKDIVTRREMCPLCGNHESELVYFTRGMNIVRCVSCCLVYSVEVFTKDVDQTRYEHSNFMEKYREIKLSEIYSNLEFQKASYILSVAGGYVDSNNIHMLDIGCSNGQMMLAAKQKGWLVEGIEANVESVKEAKSKGLNAVQGFFPNDMPDKTQQFDVITILDVLEHIENPLTFLSEVDTYLKSTGLLVIQVPNFNSLAVRLEGSGNSNFCHGHWTHFDMDTLSLTMKHAGFSPIHSETIISEIDKILQFDQHKIKAVISELTGGLNLDPSTLNVELLHKYLLGYKLFGIYKKRKTII